MKLMGINTQIEEWESSKGTKKIKITLNTYLPKLVNEIKEMEGAKFEGSNIWTVKDNTRNRFTLDILSGGKYNGLSLYYSDRERTINIDSLQGRSNNGKPFWDNQRKALQFKIKRRRCIDAEEMGLGKTRTTLAALDYFRVVGFTGPIWWIAPNSGLTALATQIGVWDYCHLIMKKMNYHALERMMEQVMIPPQMVVFDECHALKNSGARRTQLAMQLTEIMENYYDHECCVFGLTGTPAPENYFDWWAIAEVIRPGWLREKSFNQFKYRIARFEQRERIDGGMYPAFTGWVESEIERLPKRLDGLVFVAWKKDCLDLPSKIYDVIDCTATESMLRVAKAIARSGKRAIEIQTLLRELSDGFQYIPPQEIPCPSCKDEVICSRCHGLMRDDFIHPEDEVTYCKCEKRIEGCFQCNYTGKTTREPQVASFESPKEEKLKEILEEHLENGCKRIVIYGAFTASIDKIVNICLQGGWDVWRYDGRGQSTFFSECIRRNESTQSLRIGEIKEVRGFNNRVDGGENVLQNNGGQGSSQFAFTETIFQNPGEYERPLAFVGNPEAAGQGLTLTPAPTIIYYSNSFKSQFRVQSEDRIHRFGASKERGCRIIDLCCLPTDKIVLSRIKEKRSVEEITLTEIEKSLL